MRAQVGVIDTSADGARAGLHADVGVSPFQLVRGQIDRRWDATVSGSFDHTNHSAWGAAVAGGPVLEQWASGDALTRVLLEAVGRWTTDGPGGGLRATLEWSRFVVNNDEAGDSSYAFGEAALGLYVEAGAASFQDETDWMVSVGLSLRSPVLAGLACCLK